METFANLVFTISAIFLVCAVVYAAVWQRKNSGKIVRDEVEKKMK